MSDPMTTGTDSRPMTPVALDDAVALDANVVGTKAATLAHLVRLGHAVPPGVVIPVGANSPDRDHTPVAFFGALGDVVAVRSSAVDEDLPDSSFAGQYTTVLGVDTADGGAVRAAIAEVVASVESAHARSYASGRDGATAGMAVLLQRQVDARAAGVAFSADPVTGDDVAIVSAVAGLGDALVSGEATPEDWRIDADGTHHRLHGPQEVLGVADVERIGDLVRRVASDLGVPVDIEWAISTGGELWLLQARPITALPRRPVFDLPTEGTWEKDTSHLCEPLTPIAETMWVPPLEAAFRDVVDTFGLLIDGMDFRCFGGELYSHAIPPGGKEGAAPPWWAMGVVARLVPSLRRKLRTARHAVDTGVPERTIDRWYDEWKPELIERIGALRAVDFDTMTDEELLAHLASLSDLFTDAHRIHFMLFVPYLMGGAPPQDPPDLRALPEAVRQTTGAVLWAIEQEFSHTADDDTGGIAGTPASPGRYTGPVRIVRSDRDFGSLRPGDVLVCPITTPAWSLNFSRIGALVADAGGALSHAAIVAREHGIPAVVATGRATTDLRDGQLVTVDGAAGTVTITTGEPS